MIELVIFDADGVLFDSIESNIAYYNAILRRVGEPVLDAAEETRSISCAADEMFIARARGDQGKLEAMRAVARSLDGSVFFQMLKPPLELRPFMVQLRTRYRLGLATNRSQTLPKLVEHLKLEGIFDAIASVLDGVPPKPAPDILKLCIQRGGNCARAQRVRRRQPDRLPGSARSGHPFHRSRRPRRPHPPDQDHQGAPGNARGAGPEINPHPPTHQGIWLECRP